MKAPLLAALAVGLLLTGAPAAHAGDGINSLKLMPDDTNVAFNLNVKRLRSGKAYEEILTQVRKAGDFKDTEDALKKAGVNLKKDVDTVTMGMRADGKGDPAGIVVVAEGRFKEAKIVSAMKDANDDFKKLKHKGVTYYSFSDEGSMAFLGKNLVMAEADRIVEVIDRFKAKGKKSAAKSRVIKGMLSRTETKKDVWFIAEIKKAASGGFGVPMADKLKTVVGSLDLVGGLAVRMRVGFSDAATPKELVTQFATLRPMAASAPEVKKLGLDVVVNKAQLLADEKDLVFSVDLTENEAKALKALTENMGGAI